MAFPLTVYDNLCDSERTLAHSGHNLAELLRIERQIGGSVTESFLKQSLITLRGQFDDPEINGQAPDHLERLEMQEQMGKNPQFEMAIDIANDTQSVPTPNRLKR